MKLLVAKVAAPPFSFIHKGIYIVLHIKDSYNFSLQKVQFIQDTEIFHVGGTWEIINAVQEVSDLTVTVIRLCFDLFTQFKAVTKTLIPEALDLNAKKKFYLFTSHLFTQICSLSWPVVICFIHFHSWWMLQCTATATGAATCRMQTHPPSSQSH